MDIPKNKLSIGKIRVDIFPEIKRNEKPVPLSRQIVTLKPDPEQSLESKVIATKFLKNVFKDKSKYGTGHLAFKLDDTKGWKKKYGDKFIKAIGKTENNISWTGNPRAIKGLKALLPKGAQADLMQRFGTGAPFGAQAPGQAPMIGGIDIGIGQGFRGANTGINLGATEPLPGVSASPVPQVSNYIQNMKDLIKLWENAQDEI